MTSAVRCSLRFCGALRVERVANGRVVFDCPQCERRRAGVCRHSPRRVEGTVGKAIRCADCKANRRRDNGRRWTSIDENRERKNARYRERYRGATPEQKARRDARRRAWREANPNRVRRHKRAFLLARGGRGGTTFDTRAGNRRRAEAKRRYMRAKYYRDNPVRLDPYCAGCGHVA